MNYFENYIKFALKFRYCVVMLSTRDSYMEVSEACKTVFKFKLRDYGPSWRIMRPNTVNDQLLIKANRIREIETTGVNLVGDTIENELIAIVNYAIIGIIQMRIGYADVVDKTDEEVFGLYEKVFAEGFDLMQRKNHDYGEAWRQMSCESFTDIILTKIYRNKTILQNFNKTLISEGCEGNFFDIINYAVFYLINKSDSNVVLSDSQGITSSSKYST